MMRIIAGKWRGKKLDAGETRDIRPTTDRMRERLFSMLQHSRYPDMNGAYVADLCAGTGALGLEALSRGAAHCLFVEKLPKVIKVLTANVQSCDAINNATISQNNAELLSAPQPFDIIFADPPYRADLSSTILTRIATEGLLTADGVILMETHKVTDIALPIGYKLVDERRQGEQKLSFIMHDDA